MINILDLLQFKEDSKTWSLLFSEKSEDEILNYIFKENKRFEQKRYVQLFDIACIYGKEKVVQNFLTKEYTEGLPKTSVELNFLTLGSGIKLALEKEHFTILDIIFNHFKYRESLPLNKMRIYRSKTKQYIFENYQI